MMSKIVLNFISFVCTKVNDVFNGILLFKNNISKECISKFLTIFLIVIMIFSSGYFIGVYNTKNAIHQQYLNFSDKYYNDLDEYFIIKYLEKSKNEGNNEIDKIVAQAALTNSKIEGLSTIAYLITNNFSNLWWERDNEYFWRNEYGGNNNFNHKYFGNEPKYGYDILGRLRAQEGTSFHNKPYWIAYMKTGACQELAVLFNETANRAGFETRIVHNPNEDHVWNEIWINETWLYADIDCYHNKNGQNWLGNTSEYRKNCINFSEDSSIYIFPNKDQKDDITINYY